MLIIACFVLLAFPRGMIAQTSVVRPNIVFIMADDLSIWDIEPYGSTQVHTPNLARLASEGICFDNMFNVVPICAPTRQTLLTGLGPVRNGAYPNHSAIYAGIKTLPSYMHELGYRAALIGKKHYKPEASYPFEFLGGRDHDNGKGQDVDLSYTDVLPTFIDLAGGVPEKANTGSVDTQGNTGFDGESFKDVLLGKRDNQREYVYGVNTTRGIMRGSHAYATRSVRDKRFLYIHNLNYANTYSNVVTGSQRFNSWMETDMARASFYLTRPEEELYNVIKDPYQLVNLAADSRYNKIKTRLKAKMSEFMEQQGDEGIVTEMRAFDRQPRHRRNN